jgi:hypothetical protein
VLRCWAQLEESELREAMTEDKRVTYVKRSALRICPATAAARSSTSACAHSIAPSGSVYGCPDQAPACRLTREDNRP